MDIVIDQQAQYLDSDVETAIGLFLRQIGQGDGILLESADVDGRWGRYSVVVGDFLMSAFSDQGRMGLTINDPRLRPLEKFKGQPYFEGLKNIMAAVRLRPDPDFSDLPPITRGLYGYLGYGAAGLIHPKLAGVLKPEGAEGAFVLPGSVYLFDHTYNLLVKISLTGAADERPKPRSLTTGPAEIGPVSSSFDRHGYLEAAQRAKELIRRGQAMEIFLSCRFSAPFQGDLFDVYRRLRRTNSSPYMFFLRLPGITMAVSSPEVMVSGDRGRLRLCPIAGSRPRGRDLSEDSLFEEELSSDLKEQAAHVILVDSARSDLSRLAKPGSVKVDRYMEVERFAHLMHLTSHLSAEAAEGLDPVDVISATFPAGTVCGAPKLRAMEIIADLEPTDRGPYGGAIGWLGLDKDSVSLDLGLTGRCLWTRSEEIFWQNGSGLVFDSSPQSQWLESLRKNREVMTTLSPNGRPHRKTAAAQGGE